MEKEVERLRAMMRLLDIEFTGGGDNRSLQELVDRTSDLPISDTVKEFVLRTQSKAKYSNKPYPMTFSIISLSSIFPNKL